MPNGNVEEYIGSNPEVNRLRLVSRPYVSPEGLCLFPRRVSDAASGVTYLHKLGIAHGDLKAVRAVILYTFLCL